MVEGKLKYLDLLQAAIVRMATNSFVAKGWSISLTTAFIIFALRESNLKLAWVGGIPVICFWFLDAYYLSLERKFRQLFSAAATDASVALLDFNMTPGGISAVLLIQMMFRPAVCLIHLPLICVLVLLSLF